jgi:excisionase family DNA binding protein
MYSRASECHYRPALDHDHDAHPERQPPPRDKHGCSEGIVIETKGATALAALGDRLFATVPEAAQILECDPRTVRDMLVRGDWPGTRAGVHWRVSAAWLREQARVKA